MSRGPRWVSLVVAVLALLLGGLATASTAPPSAAPARVQDLVTTARVIVATYSYDSASRLSSVRQASLVRPAPVDSAPLRLTATSDAPQSSDAASRSAAEGALPELSASRSALEAKFKHAADFGVTEGRGAAGFDAYGKAIDSFVGDSSTTRILGTYRGDPAILNYNVNTAQVVVQGTDGTFISGWQMSPAQLQNVIERGSLGGG